MSYRDAEHIQYQVEENQSQIKSQLKRNNNYARIDGALQKEKELREKIRNEKIHFRNSEIKKLNDKRAIAVILWGIAIALLTTIIYFMFSCDTIIAPLIISTLPISLIVMHYISSTTEESITAITKHECDEEIIVERAIVRMYSEVLLNVDIYQFLSIPSDIRFDKNGLPYYDTTDLSSSRPYGSFTRYIASQSGSRYHRTYGCSGAYSPIHIYPLSLNDYYMNWRRYTPCQVCGGRDIIVVPQWYIYYQKVRDITNKYEIKVNYNN